MKNKINDDIKNHYVINVVGAYYKCLCGKYLDNLSDVENHLKLWNK